MPTLFGVLRREPEEESRLDAALARQAASMCRHDGYIVDRQRLDGRCGMGRVHLGILDRDAQPVWSAERRYALCMAGEFYDRPALCARFLGGTDLPGTDAALAVALFERAGFSWLPAANGQFALAVYDAHTGALHLATDRFGLRPLYVWEGPDEIVFAGEVKAILAAGGARAARFEVDPMATKEFLAFGYLLEDRTWVRGVRLLPAANVTSYDDGRVASHTYWSWDEIEPRRRKFGEAVEEMGRLWVQAVHRRVDGGKIGVLLSGGLDSRAVLAALPEERADLHCVTFGVPGCDDHEIASRAAAVRGARHHFIPIPTDDWLEPRLDAVWWTDGHLSVQHLHGIVVVDMLRRTRLFDVHMHAFAGDLIFGGSYLLPEFVGARAGDVAGRIFRKMRLATRFFDDSGLSDHVDAIVKKYRRTDVFFLHNRVRRFTINGPLKLETCLFDRKPTFDNDAIEFCYSLPDEWRYHSAVYKKMLLERFPEYYADIPWQKTGLPIGAGSARHRWHGWSRRVERQAGRYARRVGIGVRNRRDYTDYARWTREEPGRGAIRAALLSPGARWREYVPGEAARRVVEDHLDGRRVDAEAVLLLYTLEVWLRRAGL